MIVVINAAGLGTRLGVDCPKPLVEVNGAPILTHLLNSILDAAQGIAEVSRILVTCKNPANNEYWLNWYNAYASKFQTYKVAGSQPRSLQLVDCSATTGLAYNLNLCCNMAKGDRYLVCYGDVVINTDSLKKYFEWSTSKKATVLATESILPYGLIEAGRVNDYKNTGEAKNLGYFLLPAEVVSSIVPEDEAEGAGLEQQLPEMQVYKVSHAEVQELDTWKEINSSGLRVSDERDLVSFHKTRFLSIANLLRDSANKETFIKLADKLPDAFYIKPASSTGKYHPSEDCKVGGLVNHILHTVAMAERLMRLDRYSYERIFSDIIYMALAFHDCMKYGRDGLSMHTLKEHPALAAEWLVEQGFDKYSDLVKMVEYHMGQWTPGLDKETFSELEEFVQLCDYTSSQKFSRLPF